MDFLLLQKHSGVFYKNYQKKFKLLNTHLESFYLQKYEIAIVVNKLLVSIFLIILILQS